MMPIWGHGVEWFLEWRIRLRRAAARRLGGLEVVLDEGCGEPVGEFLVERGQWRGPRAVTCPRRPTWVFPSARAVPRAVRAVESSRRHVPPITSGRARLGETPSFGGRKGEIRGCWGAAVRAGRSA
jgi:hypothetical protein